MTHETPMKFVTIPLNDTRKHFHLSNLGVIFHTMIPGKCNVFVVKYYLLTKALIVRGFCRLCVFVCRVMVSVL